MNAPFRLLFDYALMLVGSALIGHEVGMLVGLGVWCVALALRNATALEKTQ